MKTTTNLLEKPLDDMMAKESKVIYWHRELPPVDAKLIGEYTVEATSFHVQGTFAHRDELWSKCYANLIIQTCGRLKQEIVRLGGDCAHVLNESVDSKHDGRRGDAWLHGRFTYVLYCRPKIDK